MAEYRNPKPTCDVIVEMPDGIVLIERGGPPSGWALPGGFCDEGEPVEHCAIREMKEEIGIDVTLTELFYVYSHPSRDPRMHTVATVFLGRPKNPGDVPKAGDDAKGVKVFPPESPPTPMAFDHAQIIADYLQWKHAKKRPDPMAKLTKWEADGRPRK